MSATTLTTVTHGLLALAIVAAATVLLALHDIGASLAIALYGGALALVGGTTNTLLALQVPPSAPASGTPPRAPAPPPGG